VPVTGGATVLTTARSRQSGDHRERIIPADVSTAAGADTVIRATLDRLGDLDILVNCVGGSTAPAGGALALTDEDWLHTLQLNLLSALRHARAFLPAMLAQGSGVVIQVSSIQRTLPLFESTLAYAAAKAALSNYS
jgi:NAD(P)-dependent dehydrogenase (short-subunit alcohol dehydrogenase family)